MGMFLQRSLNVARPRSVSSIPERLVLALTGDLVKHLAQKSCPLLKSFVTFALFKARAVSDDSMFSWLFDRLMDAWPSNQVCCFPC